MPSLPPLKTAGKQKATRGTPSNPGSDAFVVELPTKPSEAPLHPYVDSSPEKLPLKKTPSRECIHVLGENSEASANDSPARITRSLTKKSSSPMVPSTQEDAGDASAEPSQTETKRKRKRGGSRNSEGRRRKRRSVDREDSQVVEESTQASEKSSVAASQEPPSSPITVIGVQTRRSAKKQQESQSQQFEADKAVVEPPKKKVKSKKAGKAAEGGDTDEEVLSQLVSESFAASQSQSEMGANDDTPVSVIEDSFIEESILDTKPVEAPIDNEAQASTNFTNETVGNPRTIGIIQSLDESLLQIRKASLSRDDVYKIEDKLHDIKLELFEAEKRGRKRPRRTRRSRQQH
jgi:hypothetical protein